MESTTFEKNGKIFESLSLGIVKKDDTFKGIPIIKKTADGLGYEVFMMKCKGLSESGKKARAEKEVTKNAEKKVNADARAKVKASKDAVKQVKSEAYTKRLKESATKKLAKAKDLEAKAIARAEKQKKIAEELRLKIAN